MERELVFAYVIRLFLLLLNDVFFLPSSLPSFDGLLRNFVNDFVGSFVRGFIEIEHLK